MRCTGRLAKAELPTSVKHPILLEKDHHITSLIVEDSHKRVMHGGVKSTLTELGARFGSYRADSSLESYCTSVWFAGNLKEGHIKLHRPRPSQNLEWRNAHHLPILELILRDLFMSKIILALSRKYGSASTLVVLPELLIWISYPALQLPHSWEVSEHSLPIAAPPCLMVSDNGKTFKSAVREIMKLMNNPGVKQYFANAWMKWTFTLKRPLSGVAYSKDL